ncbi:MAG: ADYC domain-containing protein [Kofleriaceae bacterium]
MGLPEWRRRRGWLARYPAQLPFACRGQGAIAKCVEMGYKPWAAVGGVGLRAHHTACVRMVRGDYCGDGRAWTQDGNKINVYDALGIQRDEAPWSIDAEWTTAGATCIRKSRAFLLVPSCFQNLATLQCGDFSRGALIVNEVPLLDL